MMRLVIRAVSPSDLFRERFAERLESLACVSASLFVGGDPFAALGELDLERRGEPPVVRASVESPFAYAEHMRAVALKGGGNLVEETVDVLADLTRLLGGRTPRRDLSVLFLAYCRGLSSREIARRLGGGLTAARVDSLIHRVRRRLARGGIEIPRR